MAPAVKVVLTGDFPVYSTGDFEDTRSSGLQVEREARSLAEASPQQVPSLTAGAQLIRYRSPHVAYC